MHDLSVNLPAGRQAGVHSAPPWFNQISNSKSMRHFGLPKMFESGAEPCRSMIPTAASGYQIPRAESLALKRLIKIEIESGRILPEAQVEAKVHTWFDFKSETNAEVGQPFLEFLNCLT